MRIIGKFLVSMIIIFACVLAFIAFYRSPYFSYDYSGLPLYRFGRLLNTLGAVLHVVIVFAVFKIFEEQEVHELILGVLICDMLLYVQFALSEYNRVIFWTITTLEILIILVFTTVYVYLLIRQRRAGIFFSAFRRSQMIRNAWIAVMLIALTAIPLFAYSRYQFENQTITLSDNPVPIDMERTQLIKKYEDQLIDFQSDRFNLLSLEEKLERLQLVELIEARLEGRPAQKVIIKDIEGTPLGMFSAIKHQITLDMDFMEQFDIISILDVILHEGRHATQFYLVNALNHKNPSVSELVFYQNIHLMKQNLEGYIVYSKTKDNYMEYLEQAVEVDAEYYALRASSDYIRFLNLESGVSE